MSISKVKLKTLLKIFSPDTTAIDFSKFDNEFKKLKDNLKEKVQAQTLDDVNSKLETHRQEISSRLDNLNYQPVLDAFEQLKEDITNQSFESASQTETELLKVRQELEVALGKQSKATGEISESLKKEIDGLKNQLSVLSARKVEIPDFSKQIKEAETRLLEMVKTSKQMEELKSEKSTQETQKQFVNVDLAIKKLRAELSRGGSMNRKITFGGVDYLTRFTDINYKAGTNVTFTVAENAQTKMVDVTVTASGTGGTVRSINSVAVNTAAGATAGTDYVYLCSGTMTLTLPTAVGNTNLYTVKNVGTGVITIATTSAQTIDGNANITMATQFTSVDLISNTANWNIT